jgi:hypothetical protein
MGSAVRALPPMNHPSDAPRPTPPKGYPVPGTRYPLSPGTPDAAMEYKKQVLRFVRHGGLAQERHGSGTPRRRGSQMMASL